LLFVLFEVNYGRIIIQQKEDAMKGSITTTLVAVVLITSFLALRCGEKEEKAPAPKTEEETQVAKEEKQRFITYETLRQWAPPAGGVGIAILVAEEATKEEVLTLAQYLRSKYSSTKWLWIDIFDSKEAYLHRDDPNYPEKEYSKHWLAQVFRNPKTSEDKIAWVAEGRDH